MKVEKNEKVIFLFDEASEAINQKKFNLLDLEGVSESLSSLGGKVWTIAIAQEKLDDVINNSNVSKAQLTKVTDRFKTKIHLEATEVGVIIRNRLLKKTDTGIQKLTEHYKKTQAKLPTTPLFTVQVSAKQIVQITTPLITLFTSISSTCFKTFSLVQGLCFYQSSSKGNDYNYL